MKNIIILLLLVNTATVYSQTEKCSCENDLIFLNEKIRKTPAYKINKKKYNSTYSQVLNKVSSTNSLFECHALLNELLIALNDNHCRIYSTELGATDKIKKDAKKFENFKNSKLYNTYPKPKINLDSLKRILNNKPEADIEGIYKRDNYITIGVYKNNTENNYQAIILDSETDVWRIGEIIYNLIPFGNDYLLSIGGSLSSKRLIAYTERIKNGLFYFMGFQKNNSETNFSVKTLSTQTYYREEVSNDITYLKIGSFNSWNPILSEAEKFYKNLEGKLVKKNLILDLRNNGGGGDRNSNILLKILKEYAKNNRIYVLINHRTVSNAEQFAHKLSKLNNCKLFGARTNGTLAYEIKDSSFKLPCGNITAVLTSKKQSKYLEFESKGIEPNVTFNNGTNWISQLKSYIENN